MYILRLAVFYACRAIVSDYSGRVYARGVGRFVISYARDFVRAYAAETDGIVPGELV